MVYPKQVVQHKSSFFRRREILNIYVEIFDSGCKREKRFIAFF